ncbi:DUF721 domain-containing protein [Ruania alkalisoli]|uniref:DUF721 domain-containing protein n=1 Tax=Ruania alkalisoli TaxID=2779775 RepID=UPI001FE9211B|nr:DciA family protein [Ruania alkalisoli]
MSADDAPGQEPGKGPNDGVAEPDQDEAARSALARARDAARAKGLRTARPGTATPRKFRRHDGVVFESAPGHGSGRDPAPLGNTVDALARQLGWSRPLSIGGVIGRWREVVGDQIADHCTPETFDEGVLIVRADSTAWATQIRLLIPQLDRRLAEEVGEGVVTRIQVLGPGGPTWRRGPRVAPGGRGPRDTYG